MRSVESQRSHVQMLYFFYVVFKLYGSLSHLVLALCDIRVQISVLPSANNLH